jgi:hypothetical protein
MDPNNRVSYHLSDQDNARIYISTMKDNAEKFKTNGKGIIFYNEKFVYVMLSEVGLEKQFKEFFEANKVEDAELKYSSNTSVTDSKKKKIDQILVIQVFHKFNTTTLTTFFNREGWTKI